LPNKFNQYFKNLTGMQKLDACTLLKQRIREMRLMKCESKIKFTTYEGKEYHEDTGHIEFVGCEMPMFPLMTRQKKGLTFVFKVNGNQFVIDKLPLGNPNVSIISSVLN